MGADRTSYPTLHSQAGFRPQGHAEKIPAGEVGNGGALKKKKDEWANIGRMGPARKSPGAETVQIQYLSRV